MSEFSPLCAPKRTPAVPSKFMASRYGFGGLARTGKTGGLILPGKCVSRNVREPSHVLARHTEVELDTIFRKRVRYREIGLPV